MSTFKLVYIVDGTKRISMVEMEIQECDKRVWAVRRAGGRVIKRYLLGATAFFTRPSAEAHKLGLLRKIALGPRPYSPANSGWSKAYDDAVRQLAAWDATGAMQ